MELRKEYYLNNGTPCNEDGMFYEEYVEWLEAKLEQLQKTSSNSDYTKCIECDEQKQVNPHYSYCPNCGMHFV